METARKGWASLSIFRVGGIHFQCLLKAICALFLKKPIVYDFFKKLLSLNSLEMNKLTMNGEIQNFRPDVTFPCSVQKKTRHSCSLNWEWSRMTRVFCTKNFFRGNNHIARPKSPKHIQNDLPFHWLILVLALNQGFFLLIFPYKNRANDFFESPLKLLSRYKINVRPHEIL